MKGSEETGDGIFPFQLTASYLTPFSLWLLQHSHTGGRQLDMLMSHYWATVHRDRLSVQDNSKEKKRKKYS